MFLENKSGVKRARKNSLKLDKETLRRANTQKGNPAFSIRHQLPICKRQKNLSVEALKSFGNSSNRILTGLPAFFAFLHCLRFLWKGGRGTVVSEKVPGSVPGQGGQVFFLCEFPLGALVSTHSPNRIYLPGKLEMLNCSWLCVNVFI